MRDGGYFAGDGSDTEARGHGDHEGRCGRAGQGEEHHGRDAVGQPDRGPRGGAPPEGEDPIGGQEVLDGPTRASPRTGILESKCTDEAYSFSFFLSFFLF